MNVKKLILLVLIQLWFCSCSEQKVTLTHGIDETAGGGSAYIVSTPSAIYYLEKEGGGLSSMIDKDGVDWIGFHNEKGSGHKGEYRGFPNAIHRQDGSYFHAMNAGTDPSTSIVEIEYEDHVRIIFTSENKKWEGQWDFYSDRCDFTMTKVSDGYKYWVQYEGVPGGEMDTTDFWYASMDNQKHPITETFTGDLPAPEWMAFGDQKSSRMLFMLHHEDDNLPDNYVSRPDMTVFGFGRNNGERTTKHLTTIETFSIGFIESTAYSSIDQAVTELLD
ncbi:hypothetical protein [Winogradskyella vidalii]|uniref:hypothetical protein n=1 Tax=Winogradskyella vidalii TaxID=2615024 RepID=UPI0015C90F96|nr:hypothetical protein [Winogradskyella vidalii]